MTDGARARAPCGGHVITYGLFSSARFWVSSKRAPRSQTRFFLGIARRKTTFAALKKNVSNRIPYFSAETRFVLISDRIAIYTKSYLASRTKLLVQYSRTSFTQTPVDAWRKITFAAPAKNASNGISPNFRVTRAVLISDRCAINRRIVCAVFAHGGQT